MTLKEEFLSIKSYEEYKTVKRKYDDLPLDDEVLAHLNFLFGECYVGGDIENGRIEEVYKSREKKTIGR